MTSDPDPLAGQDHPVCPKQFRTEGNGEVTRAHFASLGDNVIFEAGVRVFHPENISIGNNVYVGHNTILKGYYKNRMTIADNVWIGQNCFFHSAGGLEIEEGVGIGPGVSIITSVHAAEGHSYPVLYTPIQSAKVTFRKGCSIGISSTFLPGADVGAGSIIGAGALVHGAIPAFEIWGGVPARLIRAR